MLQNVRFKDKEALIQYDLDSEIFKNYDFNIEEIIPVRKVFILITDKGNKIFKKINYEISDLEFINSGLNYIKKNSFKRVLNFTLTKDNNLFIRWNKKIYFIMDLIEGRESEYSNPLDVNIASIGIGELHKSSEGFRHQSLNRYTCGNKIKIFKRKLDEMDLFKNIAMLNDDKTEFDKIFLRNLEFYKQQMRNSIRILEESSYYKLCSEEDKIVLCHNDLAHHNILIKDENAYFIDFDYSIIDLKVNDLCNFINKVGKFTGYDIKRTENIINNYCEKNELSKRELEVLYGMLMFPEDFCTIIKEYYTRIKNWEYNEFLIKLIRKNDFKDDRCEFLESFRNTII